MIDWWKYINAINYWSLIFLASVPLLIWAAWPTGGRAYMSQTPARRDYCVCPNRAQNQHSLWSWVFENLKWFLEDPFPYPPNSSDSFDYVKLLSLIGQTLTFKIVVVHFIINHSITCTWSREGVYAPGGPAFLAHTKQKVRNIVGLPALRLAFFMGYE